MNIQEVFDRFITALETNNAELLISVLDENVLLRSSAVGEAKGAAQAAEKLIWKGEKLDYQKIRACNNVIRTNGDFGAQSVFLLMLLGKEINSFMNHFQCAFLNCIEYARSEEGWKITAIRSNMTFECGNTLLVAEQWSLIDYSVLEGNELHIIDTHENSPWELVPVCDGNLSDEEKIMQCFWHYNWMIDTGDFDGLSSITSEKVFYDRDPDQNSNKDWVEWLRAKRQKRVIYNGKDIPKEACWNHISTLNNIEIDGKRAKARIYRIEPNRIGTRFLHRYNMNVIYYSTVWEMEFAKTENDDWIMDHFDCYSQIIEDVNESDRRYF